MEVHRHQGVVKVWRSEKGTGVIRTDDGLDVWAGFAAIDMEGYKTLDVGQRVELDYIEAQQDSYSHRATSIRPVS